MILDLVNQLNLYEVITTAQGPALVQTPGQGPFGEQVRSSVRDAALGFGEVNIRVPAETAINHVS